MNEKVLIAGASGWVIALLSGTNVLLPYLFRRVRNPETPYRKRMRLHYWIGYAIVLLSTIHGYVAMQSLRGTHPNTTGLWLATFAFLLLFVQLTTGLQLSSKSLTNRRDVRKFHFWVMLAIVILSAAHIFLNG